MPAPPLPSHDSTGPLAAGRRRGGWLDAIVQRWPFVALFLLVLVSNAFGSFFSSGYNQLLIVNRLMDEAQVRAFWRVAFPVYNAIAYTLGIGLIVWLLLPLSRCRRRLRANRPVAPRNWRCAGSAW